MGESAYLYLVKTPLIKLTPTYAKGNILQLMLASTENMHEESFTLAPRCSLSVLVSVFFLKYIKDYI